MDAREPSRSLDRSEDLTLPRSAPHDDRTRGPRLGAGVDGEVSSDRYPPPLPVGWHFAHVVSEKPDTPLWCDVIDEFEWHLAHE